MVVGEMHVGCGGGSLAWIQSSSHARLAGRQHCTNGVDKLSFIALDSSELIPYHHSDQLHQYCTSQQSRSSQTAVNKQPPTRTITPPDISTSTTTFHLPYPIPLASFGSRLLVRKIVPSIQHQIWTARAGGLANISVVAPMRATSQPSTFSPP